MVDPDSSTAPRALRLFGGSAWDRVRHISYLLYAGVLIGVVVATGVPTGRQAIAMFVIAGLALNSIGRGWRRLGQVFLDWLPFTLVLIAYDRTRGISDKLGLPLHVGDVAGAEKWLFDGHVPTVFLQQHLYHPTYVTWFDALMTVIYATHFLATPALAAVLWVRDRDLWLQYVARVVLLAVAGLITYSLFPEAPPWYASRQGVIPQHIERLSARGWIWLHLGDVNSALKRAQESFSNPVAAMPSLHVAFATLVALFIAGRIRSRWRYLLAIYPLAMGFALVYLGEHYVLDLIFGYLYAIGTHLTVEHLLWPWWLRRRQARDRRRTGRSDPTSSGPAGDDQPIEPATTR